MDLAMAGKPEDMKVKLSLCLIGTGDREFYERLPSASAPSDRTLAQVIKAFDGLGPKCPFPLDKTVVPSTSLLYPAYK